MAQPEEHEIEALLATALELAAAARVAIMPHFRSPALNAENKLSQGFDPVTLADRAAEEAMRAILARRRPDDAVVGEEFGDTAGASGFTWLLDPIDGTRAFLSGAPTWGVLIAVANGDGPFLGVIDQPFIQERFVGRPGAAWTVGPSGRHSLRTRPPRPLSEAILFSTFPEVGTADERKGFEALSQKVRLTRYGMDCYAYALVAAGQIDLVVEAGLYPFDVAAPTAVIEAAGGIVTDWRGRSAQAGGRVIAAANAEIHAAAIEVLARVPEAG